MSCSWIKFFSRVLILTVFMLQFQPIQAALVPTDRLIGAEQQGEGDRDKVRTFLSRADVAAQLQVLGVSADDAKKRVDALTDEEIQRIAGQVDSLPAGGLLVELLLIALVAWLVYLLVVK
jgi:hypothetical protein